ncbi:MAG: putative sugar nucleotidyl transferase [Phycisphaeraceae bacterium]
MDDNARLLLFDDDQGRFGPMTDLRPLLELATAAISPRRRIEHHLGLVTAAARLPERYAAGFAERYPELAVNDQLEAGDWLLVSGRWNGVTRLQDVLELETGEALVEADTGSLVAARLDAEKATGCLDHGGRVPAGVSVREASERVLISRPWHVLDELEDLLVRDIALLGLPEMAPAADPQIVGEHPVLVAEDAKLMPGVVIIAEQGPVAIDRHATIQPFCAIEGPCYIGTGSTLAAHTAIRPGTAIGSTCKVGGEVSASVIQEFSNKAHLGYLGNSLVGRWCNLGAATTVSNLKNTYGPVRVQLEPDGEPENSGRTFHGPILGDYVRTAIGTRLLTGSVVGTGAMVALSTYPPKHTRRMGFYTDRGPRPQQMPSFEKTTRLMQARRGREPEPAELKRLRELHAATWSDVI